MGPATASRKSARRTACSDLSCLQSLNAVSQPLKVDSMNVLSQDILPVAIGKEGPHDPGLLIDRGRKLPRFVPHQMDQADSF